jgi:hypothetical protein
MARNNLSGTVIAPAYFGPGISEGTNILSGNLSTSDAANVINVPRVSNATDNSIVTNVGGDANNLTCESNLKFNAGTNTLSVVGTITASLGVTGSSARFDQYVKTGVLSGTLVSGQLGYFTTFGSPLTADASARTLITNGRLSASQVPTMNALDVGEGTFTVSKEGAVASSGSILGTTISGSSLKTDDVIINSTHVSTSLNVSASFFYGDGRYLTGISASGGGGSGGGIFTELAANRAFTTSSISVGANASPSNTLSVVGSSFLSGAVIHKRHATTTNYLVTITDYYVGVDSTSSTVLLTLPTASTTTEGQTFVIKDEAGNANNNNITISCSVGGDKIDGQNFIVLESPRASVQLYCDGATKYFIC